MKKMMTMGFCLVAIPLSIFAQTVKKYALIEHFTNTYCGICASNNPGFFTAIKVETNADVHHMAIHPDIPYLQCPLYQANSTEQVKRKAFYGVTGTPTGILNGVSKGSVSNISAAALATEVAKTSPVSVKVSEVVGVAGTTATVTVRAVGDMPTGEYRLFVAVVEKKLNFNANNGETVHYNVFRKFLSSADGDAFTILTKGTEKTVNMNYTIQSGWNANQMYVLAFLQNITTKEVMNSGTRFDITSSTDEPKLDNQVQVTPNPTSGVFTYRFDNMTPQYLTLTNMVGQVVLSKNNEAIVNNGELNLKDQPVGIYYLTLKAKEGIAVKKIVKQ
jgi:hypothetical protein